MKLKFKIIREKILKTALWTFLFVILLTIAYNCINNFLGNFLDNKTETVKQALVFVSFIGGLLGVLLIEKYKKIWWAPYITLETWQENEKLALKYQDGNINYRMRVKNVGNSSAINCLVKISLENFKPENIEDCPFSNEECQKKFGSEHPFIKQSSEFAEIEDEHLLWDIQLHGVNAMVINIPTGTSYLITIARFRKKGWYLELLSEKPNKPRAWLKIRPQNNENNFTKEYKIKIKICGDNFIPVETIKTLKSPIYDYTVASTIPTLYSGMQIDKKISG